MLVGVPEEQSRAEGGGGPTVRARREDSVF